MNTEPENQTQIMPTLPSQMALQNSQLAQTQYLPQTYLSQANYSHEAQPKTQRVIISVEEILGYVRRFWLVAGIVGLLAAVGVFTYLQTRKPIYDSTAVILLNHNSGKELNLQTVKSGEKSEYNLPALVKNLQHEIGSDKFQLSLYAQMSPELRAEVIGKKGGSEADVPEESLFLERVKQQISIAILKDSHMVSITAKHSNNETAAALANAYVEHFSVYAREQEMKQTRKVSDFLTSKASELLSQVKQQEMELLEFRKTKGIVSAQAGTDLTSSKITTLNNQLVNARLQNEKLVNMISLIEDVGDDPEELLKVPTLAETSVLTRAYTSLAQARAAVATLSVDFGRKHPTMLIAVRQEEAALENLSKLVTQYVGSFKRQMDTSKAKVKSLEAKVESAMAEMVTTSNKSVSQELKEQELASARDLYNNLVSQMNEANIALQFSGVDPVRITENALASRERIFPRTSLSAVLGGVAFAGCFLGIPLTVGFGQRLLSFKPEEKDDGGSRSGEELQQRAPERFACLDSTTQPPQQRIEDVNYPTLVTLPLVNGTEPREWVGKVTICGTESGEDLKSFIRSIMPTGSSSRGIIVTGGRASRSKSLSAAAITLAASKLGLRTLLVSCEDMVPALSSYLNNKKDSENREPEYKQADELLAPFVTSDNGLYFIADDAWQKKPTLCVEALCNAQHCVDLLVLDAPLITNEQDLKRLSDFASTSVLVRHESDGTDFLSIQNQFLRVLPNCPVAGELLIK